MLAKTASPSRGEPEVEACIRQAAQGSLWLEKTLWGLRDQEAGWIGADVLNTNGTHDLGVLQVNSAWVPRLSNLTGRSADQVRTWLRFDPCFNAQAARWIFLSALNQTKDFWKAVGVYHSPTAWRQQRYMLSVAGHLRRRFGEQLFLASQDSGSIRPGVGE
ncbi:MAG: lytic transglycosylase domain-containing protein [Sphingomonadales bacterium]|nr:lytic transglycosylase domain-containing protein [Sphingomonadales bacterium]MDE2170768.1 lytic transglycosylase domain-containing protein [Sphingomonadales bacterium]